MAGQSAHAITSAIHATGEAAIYGHSRGGQPITHKGRSGFLWVGRMGVLMVVLMGVLKVVLMGVLMVVLMVVLMGVRIGAGMVA